MPFATRDGTRLYWKLDGAADRPPLMLLNAIGTDMSLWERALPQLLSTFRVLRMDTRGHGASDASGGDYSLKMLAEDAMAVMDAAGIGKAIVAGVSLGGMIAMELALSAPERLEALALICTSAQIDPAIWHERIARIRVGGMSVIAEAVMQRFFSPAFARSHPEIVAGVNDHLIAMLPQGYLGAAAAIRDMQLTDRLTRISTPALVIAGTRDISTPYQSHGAAIVTTIKNARGLQLDCAHAAPLEAPGAVAAALREFVAEPSVRAASETLFEAGLVNRRRVLGDAWVSRSLAKRTSFNADFQAMITRIAWHEIWGRSGLDERTRRLLVVAITCALGRWEEFNLHVRMGLQQGGFTRDELREVLMQAAIYAGVPAANTGFEKAAEILATLDEIDAGKSPQ